MMKRIMLALIQVAAFLPLMWTSDLAVAAQGRRTVSSDFNGDGYADLAIGAPWEDGRDLGRLYSVGAVHVLYGSSTGLSSVGSQIWRPNSPRLRGGATEGAQFGSSVATGDFNADGFSDLAVGSPTQSEPAPVNVLYGSSAGLTTRGDQLWSPKDLGFKEPLDAAAFGEELAVGDFDGDAIDDLAIGAPTYSRPDEASGAVAIVFGSEEGLVGSSHQFWSRSTPGVKGKGGQRFGKALAAGDFGRGPEEDLAIGIPGSRPSGHVTILYGSPAGLSARDDQLWSQDTPGIRGRAERGDGFGNSLVAGEFRSFSSPINPGIADLAIGVPGKGVGPFDYAGGVLVLFGGANGSDPVTMSS